jgi:Ca2+-binding EF-hand superfamily protein
MVLSQEEIDGCREAFLAFDKDRSGTIDVWELRQVLEAMGQVIYMFFLINLYIYIYAIETDVATTF